MSDAINFPQTPTQQQHLQQQLLQQQHMQQHQQPSMTQTPSHLDASGDGNTPPIPQIRVNPAHRSSKASGTPLPQIRNPPEPYGVHEFQPKTPERNEGAGNPAGGEGVIDPAYMDASGQFPQQGPGPAEGLHFHHTPSGPFPQGPPFTPRGHTYLDPNMQHIIHDPAILQQQQMQQQILQQQQQMFNPLPPMMTPTHGMGLAPPPPGRGPAGAGVAFAGPANARVRGRAAWMQDPMHSILEEEKERKREMKLLKNREAAREGREKKRRYQMLLEARVSILETQNRALIEELKALKFLFCKPSSVMHQQAQQQPPQQHHTPQLHHQPSQQAMHYETPQTVI